MKYLYMSIIFLIGVFTTAQNDSVAFEHFKDSLNQNFKGEKLSPLSAKDKLVFDKLNFYPFNPEMVVKARFEKINEREDVEVKTSTQRKPMYTKYGYLYFNLDGKEHRLTLLKNPSTPETSEYFNYLSLMFTDETTGKDTYAVGRYMGLYAPLPEIITLNFNHTYNPYCAYSDRYSCPIPLSENHLNVAITAGVKDGFQTK